MSKTLKSKSQKTAANVVKKSTPKFGYTMNYLKIPKCCFKCKWFNPVFNAMLNAPVIDCKKKVFFPIKKQSCAKFR